jgi:hypothetical protein
MGEEARCGKGGRVDRKGSWGGVSSICQTQEIIPYSLYNDGAA